MGAHEVCPFGSRMAAVWAVKPASGPSGRPVRPDTPRTREHQKQIIKLCFRNKAPGVYREKHWSLQSELTTGRNVRVASSSSRLPPPAQKPQKRLGDMQLMQNRQAQQLARLGAGGGAYDRLQAAGYPLPGAMP